MRKTALGTAVAMIAVLAFSGSAFAGRQSSSLSLVILGSAGPIALSAVEAAQGGEVTFDVATTETDRPFVNVRCYQDGTWVYDGWHGFFESYVPDPVFTLSSLGWTAGEADCTANLVMWTKSSRLKTIATTSFHVSD